MEKDINTKTGGYENFRIIKGNLKLLPFKDFYFIDKKFVCQKCFQTFALSGSYAVRVGAYECVRTYNGKNLVYLKYKNKRSKKREEEI